MRTVAMLLGPVCCLLVACKNDRDKLEQLVPDGATAIISVDAKAMMTSELKTQIDAVMAVAALAGTTDPSVEAMNALRDKCKLDPWMAQSMVVGIDAFSKSAMMAVRMPNIGTADSLNCAVDLAKGMGLDGITVGETDGKPSITIKDEGEGWALDDDTLVVSSKAWSSGVKARIAGEGKPAIDNGLAEAAALADRSRHVWFAGEVPGLVAPLLDDTPAKGLRRAAGSVHYGKEVEIALAAGFADADAAKALHTAGLAMLEEAKAGAASKEPTAKKLLDGVSFEIDGTIVRGKVVFDMQSMIDESVGSFTGYMNRSKIAEASMNTSRIARGVSIAYMENATCPTNGSDSGETGITPPLSVDCSKGLSGNCNAVASPSAPGEYSAGLWSDNTVWNALQFDTSMPHRFHYNYKWTKTATGCDFTVQAFGDLDGDATFSTFERTGNVTPGGADVGTGEMSEVDPLE